jgi:hypothetical protein
MPIFGRKKEAVAAEVLATSAARPTPSDNFDLKVICEPDTANIE